MGLGHLRIGIFEKWVTLEISRFKSFSYFSIAMFKNVCGLLELRQHSRANQFSVPLTIGNNLGKFGLNDPFLASHEPKILRNFDVLMKNCPIL